VLLGRQDERARIERLLDDARLGRSGVLVLRGEPGIGKTALLRLARELAEGMTILRATGVPAEADLEYSGLVELLRPVLSRLDRLPDHQATSLREAVGLAASVDRQDRFAVGAAVLSLLAVAAEERPILVLVDDAQWLDRASADTLKFASRRLFVDRVAVLVAERDGEAGSFTGTGFEELHLSGLARDDVAVLLRRFSPTSAPVPVLERVHQVTGGNPLAVIELGHMVSPDEIARRYDDELAPMPVGPAIQEAFARRAADLPEETRRALLLVAVATRADIDTIGRSIANLGLEFGALESAEDAGLIAFEQGAVVFTHPLVRAAIYHSAAASERRAAHRALADALGVGDHDRRAWHLAGAALGPDEPAAGALAALAERARERGAHATAASALEHAARLSTDSTLRVVRLIGAADAAWAGGQPRKAITLLEEALPGCRDTLHRARLLSLRGRIEHEVGHQVTSRELLLEAAALVEDDDPRKAASTLMYALAPLHYGGDVAGVLHIAERARQLAPRDGSYLDSRADSYLGWALFQAGRGDEAVAMLEEAIRAVPATGASRAELRRTAISLALLERATEAEQLTERIIEVSRREGPTALCFALDQATRYTVRSGQWRRATACGEEGLALAYEIGTAADVANILVLLARVDAARGREQQCRDRVAAATETASTHGLGLIVRQARAALGLLELGLGELDTAAETLADVARETERMGLFSRDLTVEPDLIETLIGLGRIDEARYWLDAYAHRASRASPKWGAALVERGRGLVAIDDDEAHHHLAAAVELHRAVPDRFEHARTLLHLGERMRRAGRRSQARELLRDALESFEDLEAAPWEQRVRAELRASGETTRRARHHVGDALTPHELQVALQVAEGKTNKEAAAALYLSPKTIEFHLARVYPKLGVRSRAELIKRISVEGLDSLALA
jgi:DNA-binding CsgD family transcriptional regulator